MAVASFKRRAGMTEIRNKQRKIEEQVKAIKEAQSEKPAEEISQEEHAKRLEMLKNLGLFKE